MLEDHSAVFTKNVQCDLESDHPLDNSLDKSGN